VAPGNKLNTNRRWRELNMSKEYGVVYFIGSEDGPIKIGYSSDVSATKRLRQLQTASAKKYQIYGVVSGGMSLEKTIHRYLHAHLVMGEWYARQPALELMTRLMEKELPLTLEYTDLLHSLNEIKSDLNTKSGLASIIAADMISDVVHELASVNTLLALPLKAWLSNQLDRDDPIGDLAREHADNGYLPATGNFEDYMTYIVEEGQPAVTRTMVTAWIECDIETRRLTYS